MPQREGRLANIASLGAAAMQKGAAAVRSIKTLVDHAKERGAKISKEVKEGWNETIYAIAKERRQYSGKWLINAMLGRVDAVWANIALATRDGLLGPLSKVSTAAKIDHDRNRPHVVCVYVEDSFNLPEVEKVLSSLLQLGRGARAGFEVKSFKLDLYTKLGINTNDRTLRNMPGMKKRLDLMKEMKETQQHWWEEACLREMTMSTRRSTLPLHIPVVHERRICFVLCSYLVNI